MKKGWETKRIGEIATIRPPKREARERVGTDALVSFLPMEDLGVAVKYPQAKHTRRLSDVVGSYTYFAEGDVLLAKITPCFENGKLGIAKGLKNGIGFGSSEFIVIRPDSTVSNEWLFHFLSREVFRNEGAQRMGGAVGQQRVPKEFVESYALPVPPLPEQKRIVGVLDEAFAELATAQANAEKNLQNARALFESHLQSVFTHRGKGWIERKLGEICDFEGGSQPPKSQFVYAPKAGYVRFLQIRDFASEKHVTFIPESKKNRLCSENDIMIGRYGASVGKILTGKAGAYNVALMQTIPDTDVLERGFFFHYLLSKVFQEPLGKVADRSAQNGFSKEDIFGFPVPVPPLAEQRNTTTQLDALAAETQRLARIYEQKQAALAELKKSLLHQAFSGEL